MNKKIFSLVSGILIALLALTLGVGCKSGAGASTTNAQETTTAAAETTAAVETTTTAGETTALAQKLKIGYISKFLNHIWFLTEADAIKKFCEENGVEYLQADAEMDDQKMLQKVDEMIAQGVNGLVICATSQKIGVPITEKCAKAGVAVVAIDDFMDSYQGGLVPYVGLSNYGVCYTGAEQLAKLANERDFFKEGNVVKVINILSTKIPVLVERVKGHNDALTKNTPLKFPDDFLTADTEQAFLEEALVSTNAIVSAHPEVTHWLVTGTNDDCAVAAIRTFEELGIDKSNYISLGLGGYDLALEELAKGNDSFISMGLRADLHGRNAAQELYEFIVNKTPMKEKIEVPGTLYTVDNYKESPFYKEK